MTLMLDGEQVHGKELQITANLRIESADLSGQTSNTATAHKGFKPKGLTVNLMIPYVDQTHLVALVRMAEKTAGGGQLHTYRVVNKTAEAFGVRQVQFSDNLSVREDDLLRAWRIQFTLTEKLSNPERVETRRPGNKVQQQTGTGATVADPAAGGDGKPTQELTGFERILQRVDQALEGTP
ncbi:TPA: DNA-binding protein [Pseudomonas aeruginosa]|uniref:baseplate complex protein n=1 Tax=Pseudomonas aeruginosa TaxID=287 RepID=UPI002288E002|nr:DNA-binding protein [Pseudomonas aeruginosa]MDU0749483.1 DNA-binding protein [Pseudomonas aeruginosa]HCL4128180.1 DNA-binding protein [Pseudomonas aeruginosa]HCW1034833.1 DNA-binding protein [Pseudomonas aeruginosa]HCW1045983.1 DNA-binding protein [Pseudomonas aeruginosa]